VTKKGLNHELERHAVEIVYISRGNENNYSSSNRNTLPSICTAGLKSAARIDLVVALEEMMRDFQDLCEPPPIGAGGGQEQAMKWMIRPPGE
jgi:hypothetical protein